MPAASSGVRRWDASGPIHGTIARPTWITITSTMIAIQIPGLTTKIAHPCLNQSMALPGSTLRLAPPKAGAGIGKCSMTMLVQT